MVSASRFNCSFNLCKTDLWMVWGTVNPGAGGSGWHRIPSEGWGPQSWGHGRPFICSQNSGSSQIHESEVGLPAVTNPRKGWPNYMTYFLAISGLHYCNMWGIVTEDCSETSDTSKCISLCLSGNDLLVRAVQWFPICFWAEFKELITFDAVNGTVLVQNVLYCGKLLSVLPFLEARLMITRKQGILGNGTSSPKRPRKPDWFSFSKLWVVAVSLKSASLGLFAGDTCWPARIHLVNLLCCCWL